MNEDYIIDYCCEHGTIENNKFRCPYKNSHAQNKSVAPSMCPKKIADTHHPVCYRLSAK